MAEVIVVGMATGVFGSIDEYAIHYLLNIVLFYVAALWLYPKIFKGAKSWMWKLPLFGTITYIINLSINYAADNYLLKQTSWYGLYEININKRYIFSELWRSLLFMGFAGFYYLFRQYVKEIETRKKTEREYFQSQLSERELKLSLENAKNAYLKAQINPHLLFNTLSFIYQDIMEKAPRSAEAVMQLSDIMRYSINCEYSEPLIELKEEIEQAERLICLHSIRFDGDININLIYSPDIPNLKFLPLVLLTLVENIFKHGIFQDANFPAEIFLKTSDKTLVISSRNWPKRKSAAASLHMGLDNIKQRIDSFYRDQARLSYGMEGDIFLVEITVPKS